MAMQYYRKPLIARATTSQPIISEQDINTMFYRVEDLYDLHRRLSEMLEPSLENWSTKTCVSGFFVQLVSLGIFCMGNVGKNQGRG
jgi:breakpoint cluster region protein